MRDDYPETRAVTLDEALKRAAEQKLEALGPRGEHGTVVECTI